MVQVKPGVILARALVNLSDTVTVTDPAVVAEAARAGAAHSRRAGARHQLSFAAANLAQALLMTGDWDTAEAELTPAIDGGGLADFEDLACYRAWLAALRGATAAAEATLADLPVLRASEGPEDQAIITVAEAFTAARGQSKDALRYALATLAHAGTLRLRNEALRWAWPLAARSAYELGDTFAAHELLTELDSCPPGYLAPLLRAERELARAPRRR